MNDRDALFYLLLNVLYSVFCDLASWFFVSVFPDEAGPGCLSNAHEGRHITDQGLSRTCFSTFAIQAYHRNQYRYFQHSNRHSLQRLVTAES